jgi:hypothetical protein
MENGVVGHGELLKNIFSRDEFQQRSADRIAPTIVKFTGESLAYRL